MVDLPDDISISEAFRLLRSDLSACGIDAPELDARLIILGLTGLKHADFIACPDKKITSVQKNKIIEAAGKRLKRMPLSQILGEKEFYSRNFKVTEHTLTPRPDSEVLIEVACDFLKSREKPYILDLGTGTGCLLLTLLAECHTATGLGVDISSGALLTANENLVNLGLESRCSLEQGNWFDGVDGQFDLIISNPPYIPTQTISDLEAEVRLYDPHIALNGGKDGLDPYRVIIGEATHYLKKGGMLLFEIGHNQKDDVMALFSRQGLRHTPSELFCLQDLEGRDRCVYATY